MPDTVLGMALMVVVTVIVAVQSALVRQVSGRIHPFEIVFFASVFACLLFAPLFLARGREALRARRLGLITVRAVLNAFDLLLIFTAFSLAPLATVIAIDFSAPLFATVLAVLVLGEAIRARRITALVVGFAGILVIVRPGLAAVGPGVVAAILAAVFFGIAIVVTKVLTRTETSAAIAFYTVLLAVPFALAASLPFWVTPTWSDLVQLIAIGAGVGSTHWLNAEAYRLADLTAVLPIYFLSLVWVSILAAVYFDETPDVWTWIGAVLVFAAAYYIADRESRLARSARPTFGASGRIG